MQHTGLPKQAVVKSGQGSCLLFSLYGASQHGPFHARGCSLHETTFVSPEGWELSRLWRWLCSTRPGLLACNVITLAFIVMLAPEVFTLATNWGCPKACACEDATSPGVAEDVGSLQVGSAGLGSIMAALQSSLQ